LYGYIAMHGVKNIKYFVYLLIPCVLSFVIFVSVEERERATSYCRTLHNDYHHKRYSLPHYVWVIVL